MSKGFVYFVIAAESVTDVRCKIGFTRGNPVARLRDLQCGSPVKLKLYAYTQGSREAERIFHETFAPLRLHGEWFKVDAKLRDFLFYLILDAEKDGVVSGETLMTAVLDVIMATDVLHPDQNKEEYLASADSRHWEKLRPDLEAAIEAGTW